MTSLAGLPSGVDATLDDLLLRAGETTWRAGCAPWHSLWTGDVGLAVYLWDCVRGEGGLPGLERL